MIAMADREEIRLSDLRREPGGLRCPVCGCKHFRVLETREWADQKKRRRECVNCGWRGNSYERLDATT